MKEFDLEKAKAGAPVCTRDGRPVRIICWDFQEYGQEKADELKKFKQEISGFTSYGFPYRFDV